MRVTSLGSSETAFAARQSPYGDYIYTDKVVSYITRTLKRDDIRRNVKDSTGWRNPSPYTSTLSAAEAGFYKCKIALLDWGPGYYFIASGKVDSNTNYPTFTISADELYSLLPPKSHIDIAVVKARNNVADRVASFGESLAELLKTLSGLGSLAQQINAFLENVARRNWKGVADSLGIPRNARRHRRAVIRYNKLGIPTVSNAFLCWNFGLKPIISDMVSLAILMGQGKPLRVVGKGLYFDEGANAPRQKTYNLTIPWVGGGMEFTAVHNERRRVGTVVRLDYEVDIPTLRHLSSYGLLDSPATLWALVPYSFLVDFVLPVSEVLRSLTATLGLTFKGGSATQYVKVDRVNGFYAQPSNNAWRRVDEFRCVVPDLHGVKSVRTVFITDPNPITLWMKDPLSAFSVATVLSLLGQKLGRKTFT